MLNLFSYYKKYEQFNFRYFYYHYWDSYILSWVCMLYKNVRSYYIYIKMLVVIIILIFCELDYVNHWCTKINVIWLINKLLLNIALNYINTHFDNISCIGHNYYLLTHYFYIIYQWKLNFLKCYYVLKFTNNSKLG